jgi:predicted transposase/invertase (TIGR01784 family)
MNLAPAYDKWLEEVEAKAIAKGEAQGETQTQETIARRMFQINLPIETIAEVTGLSIETLEKLRSSQSSI